MPQIRDPLPSPDPQPSAADPNPGDGDEASVRLLLNALVSRLQRQPLELAERAVGHARDPGPSEPTV